MILPDNGAQVRGGGISGSSAKSPSLTFFFEAFPKCNNCEYQTPYKANHRRHVKN